MLKTSKTVFSAVGVFAVATMSISIAYAVTFTDVDASEMYAKGIEFLSSKGIVNGNPDGTFAPQKTLNRAEMVKIVAEAKCKSMRESENGNLSSDKIESIFCSFDDFKGKQCFSDVPMDAWYTKYVCYAKDKGWVKGYEGNLFKPTQDVTFVEGLKIEAEGFGSSYDKNSDPWYKDLVDNASNQNYIPPSISGFNNPLKRGEMAEMISRKVVFNKDNSSEDLKTYLDSWVNVKPSYDTIAAGKDLSVSADIPVVIYTEEVKQSLDPVGSRSYPTVKIWEKVGDQEPILLADNIGKIGEYAGSFRLSKDNKILYINLESKMQKLDIATKSLTDFFTPKKQIQSYLITNDGKSMYIWDQIYASSTDYGYYLHLLDLTNGADKILTQGTLPNATYLFINAVRDDGILALSKAMGEASEPWSFNPEKDELRKVPGMSPALYGGVSRDGKYIAVDTKEVVNVCNDFFAALPSIYELRDSYTGEIVDSFGVSDKATDILGFSTDDSEVLFSSYQSLIKAKSTDYNETQKECSSYAPVKTYYRMVVGTGKAVKLTNYQEILDQWGLSSAAKSFDLKYVTENGETHLVVSYKGKKIFTPKVNQSIVEYYVP